MRRLLIDTLAIITFYTPLMMCYELAIGLTLWQSLAARGMGIIVNGAVGRPYGIFRDYVWRKTGTTEKSSQLRKASIDILTAAMIHSPLYAMMILIVGATTGQIAAGMIFVAIVATVTGRPYGIYLDWFRKRMER